MEQSAGWVGSLRSLDLIRPQLNLGRYAVTPAFARAHRMIAQLCGRLVAPALLALVCVACQRAQVAASPVVTLAHGATLSGEVRADRRRPPVQNALARLSAPARAWRDSTFTDSQGRFTFSALEPGEYVLDVSMIGFRRHRQSLKLAPNQPAQLRVVLRADSLTLHADCLAPDGRSMGQQYCR